MTRWNRSTSILVLAKEIPVVEVAWLHIRYCATGDARVNSGNAPTSSEKRTSPQAKCNERCTRAEWLESA